VAVALCAYLAAAVGLPVPVAAAGGRAFPGCGCGGAERCQQGCCCSTARPETPPEPAEDTGAPACCSQAGEDGPNAPADEPCCCCQGKEGGACCGRSCCRKKRPSRTVPPPLVWRPTLSASRCRGVATAWVSLGAVLPPRPVTWSPCRLPPSAVSHRPASAPLVPHTPPDPPPRLPSV